MPELGLPKREFTKRIHEYNFLTTDEARELLTNYNEKYVGKGAECVVIENKKNPETVLAFTYRTLSPEIAKRIFYTQRIFSTLFPKNFPRFFAAFGSLSGKSHPTGTVREKIAGDVSHYEPEAQGSVHPFSDVKDFVRAIGLPQYIFDFGGDNMMYTEEREQYYIDVIQVLSPITSIQKLRIINFMSEMRYSESEKRDVEISIERLNQLLTEEMYQNKKAA